VQADERVAQADARVAAESSLRTQAEVRAAELAEELQKLKSHNGTSRAPCHIHAILHLLLDFNMFSALSVWSIL
jgi:hypothetical protein